MEQNPIQRLINELVIKYHNNKQYPTDQEIIRISIDWAQRDWELMTDEGRGFQRGLENGMKIMRNIIEYNEDLYTRYIENEAE